MCATAHPSPLDIQTSISRNFVVCARSTSAPNVLPDQMGNRCTDAKYQSHILLQQKIPFNTYNRAVMITVAEKR